MAKKRANGEGSIRKRKDGRWEGRYTVGYDPDTGKPIIKNVLAPTQAECRKKLNEAKEKSKKIDYTKPERFTVEQWVTLWYKNYAKPNIRETTADNYRCFIENHIIPNIGSIRLDKLSTIQLQQFYTKTKESGRIQRYEGMDDFSLSGKTVRGLHAMLRMCLDQAVAEKIIPSNPADACRLPKKEKKEMVVIPPDRISDYLDAAEAHGVLPMFYLELTTGLRRGEITALLWSDLDIEEQSLKISKSVLRINREIKVCEPKTKNSVRTLYLPQQTIDLLIQEHEKHPDNPYMFPSPVTGSMYGPDCVGRIHKKLLKRAGIDESIRFHDLRHTFATMALRNGIDVKTISNILGHYSAGFTLDTYTHVTGDMKKSAASRIGEMMPQR